MHKRTKLLDISKAVKDKVWERDGHRCILCESIFAMPNAHYISRAQGGLGIPENVVTLCIRRFVLRLRHLDWYGCGRTRPSVSYTHLPIFELWFRREYC